MKATNANVAATNFPYLAAEHRAFSVYRAGSIFRASKLRTSDGVSLAVLHAGDPSRPTILLVNALGMSGLFLATLARRLAAEHHVVTWESRGLPDASSPETATDLSVARHARDAAEILERLGCAAVGVVAYCSGANVAVCALAEGYIVSPRLCIVSPSMDLPGAVAKTEYQRTMLPMWRMTAEAGAQRAALVRALLGEAGTPEGSQLDAELAALNKLPFHSVETTYRYARMQAACLAGEWTEPLGRLRAETLVLHGAEDDVIHADTPRALAEAVRGAAFLKIGGTGHFAIYASAELQDRVLSFLGRSTVENVIQPPVETVPT